MANSIAGQASVIHGDTIKIHGEQIRLVSVDALEFQKTYLDGRGGVRLYGQQAAMALSDVIEGRPEAYFSKGRDQYSRILR